MTSILAAVDFSDSTDGVAHTAATLARALGGKLFLVYVANPEPVFVGYDVGPQAVRDSVAEQHHREHQMLQALKSALDPGVVEVTALMVQGATVEKIVDEARRLEAGFVVLGSHGHGALYHLLTGSVTEGVLRAAPCPVVVVPRGVGRKESVG